MYIPKLVYTNDCEHIYISIQLQLKGIHAREWIAPATAMLILARLITGYKSADTNVRYLVESLDWYLTIVLNPGG